MSKTESGLQARYHRGLRKGAPVIVAARSEAERLYARGVRVPRLPRRPAGSLILRIVAAAVVAFAIVRLAGWAGGPYPLSSLLAFTPYVLGASVLVAVIALLVRDHHAGIGAVLAAAVLAVVVAPREVAAKQPNARGPVVTITTANLLHGEADPRALREIIRRHGSDIVALQELNQPYIRKLRQVGALSTVPEQILGPGQRYDETGVASRWPVLQRELGLPTVYNAVSVDVPGYGPLTVVSSHPTPPMSPFRQERWRGWLSVLPGPSADALGGRAVLAGDFNATLDHPQLRRLLNAGWRDSANERGDGLVTTWHGLPLTRLTIDHVLVPPGAAVKGYVVDDLPGSDHRAVTVTLQLPAG